MEKCYTGFNITVSSDTEWEESHLYYLGIDLGGTNIAAGITDDSFAIIARANRKTKVPCEPLELVEDLAQTALEALANAHLSLNDVPWIGIGCPGTVNRQTGIVEYANNLYLENFPLKGLLTNRLQKEVIIENDANAAAYGEYKAGALRGADNAVAITLGTGVGSGIILNGSVYSGSNFAGGEMGHTVIAYNGRLCTCGRRGCWEAYSSATGLIQTTRLHMLLEDPARKSRMWSMVNGNLEQISGRTAFDAMREGDSLASQVVDEYISYLACGIVNCINIFQPDILCIGGGISNEKETLLTPLREQVEKQSYNSTNCAKRTKICRAELGNDAGIIGAALLGI